MGETVERAYRAMVRAFGNLDQAEKHGQPLWVIDRFFDRYLAALDALKAAERAQQTNTLAQAQLFA